MKPEGGILAIFSYLDQLTDAMRHVRARQDFEGHEVYSPTSYHEIEAAMGHPDSPVKYYTLVGGLAGCVGGFALCLILDYDWPLIVGGKLAGIYSLPAYVVIGFECTILLGAIATILGMLVHCRIPNIRTTVLDPRLSDDKFGIFVPGVSRDSEQARFLKECGAEEIRYLGENP